MAVTNNLSKMVMQRKRLRRSFLSELRCHRGDIATRFAARLAEEPQAAQARSAMELLLGLLDHSVERANVSLERAGDRHHRRLVDAKRLRRRRDQATVVLYREVVEVREAVAGLYGTEAVVEIRGLRGRTARKASLLLEQTSLAVTMLREWRPYPAKAGGAAEPGDWLAKLEPPLERLQAIFAEASPEMLRNDPTREAKLRAITAFDDAFSPALRMLCLLLELSGEGSIVTRLRLQLRPSVHS